ncbi:NAD-dependent epimerase/dehydratase family protein [Clostridium lacusfryxellense]|uniref:NAD-dependent epimerase/dehydratase family protein n=1 Tax=Clostridium lacusfryxellense TaxID=205328 RepID=UPI001C0E776E|nr:NAD-dependent epimerase/dehydratase family protein [Clostridium lacusfryxellense]MBU3110758.1 NAD-dependent epimerase/dehydratase family protein [Clostridium lacusfryxellense]
MRILVTGGAGFIASHIVDRLIDLNHHVCIVDNLFTGKEDNINDRAIFYKCDITEMEKLKMIFKVEKPEIVIHHAAQIDIQTSLKKPVFDAETNIIGTINILECCREFGVKKIIYPSSAAVYGHPKYLPVEESHGVNPISFYGISKHTPEHYIKIYAQLYGLKYTIFRYANVYGERQDSKGEGGVVSIFVDRLLNNQPPFIFGNGEQTRDFIYVKDIAEANILALYKGDNEIMNISSNKATTVNELFMVMRDIAGSNVEAIYKDERKGDIEHSYLNNRIARITLGWKVRFKLEDGVRETVQYYKKVLK